VSPDRVFTAVSEGCARVLEVNASAVLRFQGDGAAAIVGRHNRDGIDVFRIGEALPDDERTAIGRVRSTGAPARVDDWGGQDASAQTAEFAEAIFRTGYRSTAAAPILVAGALWGALAIASEDPLPPDAENRLVAFCELASLAVASAQARADLVASRARVVKAGDEQRRRLERNLHDGAQQRLVSVALNVRLARGRVETDTASAVRLLDDASRELDAGMAELRELARGLHPAILGDHGLPRALDALAARMPIPVDLDAALEARPPEHIEATAYYIVSEALANAARHAHASRVRVAVRRDGDVLRCEIADDGRGGADEAGGTGLLGLRDRAEAVGGTLAVSSPPGAGTVVTATLPVAGS
jgi:signal transduction histidine kinase